MSGYRQMAKWCAALALVCGVTGGQADAQSASGKSMVVSFSVNGNALPGDGSSPGQSVVLDYAFEATSVPGQPAVQQPVRLLLNRSADTLELLQGRFTSAPVEFRLRLTEPTRDGGVSTFVITAGGCTVTGSSLFELQGAARAEFTFVCEERTYSLDGLDVVDRAQDRF